MLFFKGETPKGREATGIVRDPLDFPGTMEEMDAMCDAHDRGELPPEGTGTIDSAGNLRIDNGTTVYLGSSKKFRKGWEAVFKRKKKKRKT